MNPTTTHVGKIGRLSKDRRNELAHHIEDGQPGTDLVQWLNAQPDVQAILTAQFGGRPITEQNLSDWKRSGHLDWLRQQEARDYARQINDRAVDVEEEMQERNLSDRFATVLASEMSRLAMTLLEPETDPEKRWRRLCRINREFSQMRRDDHRAVCTEIKRERWSREVKHEEEEAQQRAKQAPKRLLTEMLLASLQQETIARAFGGGETGREIADLFYRLRFDLPLAGVFDAKPPQKPRAVPVKQKAGEKPAKSKKSSLIKPNPVGKDQATEPAPAKRRKARKTPAKRDLKSNGKPRTPKPAKHLETDPITPVSNPATSPDNSRQPATSPIRHSSSVIPPISPTSPISPIPPISSPTSDPEQEAFNTWFRMHNNFEPFNHDLLEKLYAAIPPKAP